MSPPHPVYDHHPPVGQLGGTVRMGMGMGMGNAQGRIREERGATAVIVVLSLFALFGMIVLTVDVGGLLWARRGMVNASDAAALAAAQSCVTATENEETFADQFADLNSEGVLTTGSNIT